MFSPDAASFNRQNANLFLWNTFSCEITLGEIKFAEGISPRDVTKNSSGGVIKIGYFSFSINNQGRRKTFFGQGSE